MSTQREADFGALSLRLSAVAEWIPPGRVVADIGSDHAQLLIALSRSGLLKRGIAGEVNQGPWENARNRVKKAELEHKIQVRKGDGLEVLDEGEAQVIVIAGMGGPLMASILDRGVQKLKRVERLVLQPNSGVDHVRRWLHRHSWKLDGENLVREAGVLYEVLTASPGDPHEPYRDNPLPLEAAFEVGPILWRTRHPLLKDKLEAELKGFNRILSQLESARTPESRHQLKKMEKKQDEWRRWHQWLQQERN